jgi:hypothetical protein
VQALALGRRRWRACTGGWVSLKIRRFGGAQNAPLISAGQFGMDVLELSRHKSRERESHVSGAGYDRFQ